VLWARNCDSAPSVPIRYGVTDGLFTAPTPAGSGLIVPKRDNYQTPPLYIMSGRNQIELSLQLRPERLGALTHCRTSPERPTGGAPVGTGAGWTDADRPGSALQGLDESSGRCVVLDHRVRTMEGRVL
jgi:hypothetical protein